MTTAGNVVLIADDSESWVKAFHSLLNRSGFKSDYVMTGNDLKRRVINNPERYSLLIVDNSMPEEVGQPETPDCGVKAILELNEHFRNINRGIRALQNVIIRSIYSREDIIEISHNQAYREVPVKYWFDRNVTLMELMGAIESMLNK